MNRKQKLLSILGCILMGITGAANAQPFNQYFNAQGALADVDGFDSGIGGILTYGLRVPEMHKNFSVEGEFTTTLVEPEGKFFGSTYEASYFTLAGYGVYTHTLNEKFQVRGRVGLLYEDVEVSSPVSSRSDDDFGLSFGVGLTVGLSNTSRFIVEYTIIDSDINHISAGMQFKL